MATLTVAAWAQSLTPSSVPPHILRATLRSFYNYAGCAIGGSKHEAVRLAENTLSRFFGSPTSTLLGNADKRVDAQHAALLNGIASHVHDYDDTHLETIIHPTGPVASALLAIVESEKEENRGRVISGNEMLVALVTGIEVACKLGLAVWPDHYDVGWHITSTTGSIGAAVAVGKILSLNVEQMAHAIGIAATQVTGLREMFGSHTKSFHVGRAAQNGLMAAVLAKGGFTSSTQALEAKRGWANVVSNVERLREQVASLGQLWEIEKNAFKPFPCGIVIHPVIDGCARLHETVRDSLVDICTVSIRVHPLVLELTGKKTPKDGLEAKFSVYHGGALGLIYGMATPALYEDTVVRDPGVIDVRDRFEASVDETLRPDEAFVVVELSGGRKLEKHVEHALGSREVPMTDEQLTAKFIDQSSEVVGRDRAISTSEAFWGIGAAPDAVQVIRHFL